MPRITSIEEPARRPARWRAARTPGCKIILTRGGSSGCVGLRCYVDDIDAPGLNDVAINWNASLAWLAAYVSAAGR